MTARNAACISDFTSGANASELKILRVRIKVFVNRNAEESSASSAERIGANQ